jgi:uncharacterized protein DUF4919
MLRELNERIRRRFEMKKSILAAVLLLLCVAAGASAQTPTPTPTPTPAPAKPPAVEPSPTPAETTPAAPSDAQKKYDAMLEQAKKGEGTVDYKALRFAYFETPDFSPFVGMSVYRSLWGVLNQGNWAEAIKQAEAVLEKNYVDVNAHMVAFIAHHEQGNEEKAKHHRRWAEGLLESVKSGGDGKSLEAAWHVISISEEYAVLRSLSLRPVGQSLVNDKGHAYDVMKTVDPKTNTEATFFFNVDKPFSAYGRK